MKRSRLLLNTLMAAALLFTTLSTRTAASSAYSAYASCPVYCPGYTSSTSCEQQPACDWSPGYCTGFGGGDLGCYGIRYENQCYAYGCSWVPAHCYQATC